MKKSGKLFLIAAPSGTGKTTVTNHVIENLREKLPISRVITYTTRPKRPGEVDGEDYFFVDKPTFLRKVAQQFFLEVTNYNDQCYGSPQSIIKDMEQGQSFIIVTDRAGVISLKELVPDALAIWLSPPSLAELEQRLIKRGTESKEEIRKRLAIAQEEMKLERHNPIFDIHITNHIIKDVVTRLCRYIEQQLT